MQMNPPRQARRNSRCRTRPIWYDMSRRAGTIVLLCAVATTLVTAQRPNGVSMAAETYDSATVDADGQLLIVKTNGQRVLVRKEAEQTAFSQPAISSARTAVAAGASFVST